MRSTQVAEASCLYCADVLIPDVRVSLTSSSGRETNPHA